MAEDNSAPKLLPHHEQQDLCSTRLPYRQGRKLTAVKVYTVNNESRHLLVFGVPSLNLRQETKALFSRFGKLQLNVTKYPSEQFTETFHAVFEDIQSARIAKKMLDTKNYYGGILHICYAPELENLDDTRAKLLQRQKSVIARVKNLQKPTVKKDYINEPLPLNQTDLKQEDDNKQTIYMGNENNIEYGKRKSDYKSVKHCKLKKSRNFDRKMCVAVTENALENTKEVKSDTVTKNVPQSSCEIVDFTSTESNILTNINESLNYDNFGKELIRAVPYKPVNKIQFNLNKNL